MPIPRRTILMLPASISSAFHPTARVETQSHQVSTPCDGAPLGIEMSLHEVAIPRTSFSKQPAYSRSSAAATTAAHVAEPEQVITGKCQRTAFVEGWIKRRTRWALEATCLAVCSTVQCHAPSRQRMRGDAHREVVVRRQQGGRAGDGTKRALGIFNRVNVFAKRFWPCLY